MRDYSYTSLQAEESADRGFAESGKSQGEYPQMKARGSALDRAVQAGVVFFTLAVSVPTFPVYYSRVESNEESITCSALLSSPSSRRVSLMEARRIALRVLEEAEARRLRFAEEEAKRGLQLEDLP
jgi:hypothetical protein